MDEDKVIQKIIELESSVEDIKDRLVKLDTLDMLATGQDKILTAFVCD